MRIYHPKPTYPKIYLETYALNVQDFYKEINDEDYNEFVIEPIHNGPEQTWEPHLSKSINTRYNQMNGGQ